jgi:hypothetical protein
MVVLVRVPGRDGRHDGRVDHSQTPELADARAASGRIAAAPPMRVMNSRRLMGLTPRLRITN